MSINTHVLKNGLTIVTEYMPGIESVTLGMWVKAGARHESKSQNGIAHFLEHMAFKGTDKRSALDIAHAIENVGGYLNAYTSRELTAYYVRVLGEDVPLAVDVISDILINSIFDQKEIETERGVILQEIGQSLDTPDDIIFDWLQEASYPNQAMGRPILGPKEKVNSFCRSDFQNFMGKHYSPDRMIFAAAGAVDHDKIVKQLEGLFDEFPCREKTILEPAKFITGHAKHVKPLEQAHVALAFEMPSYKDEYFYSSQVFSMIMGGGMSSRLFQEIREERGLCYTIFSQASALFDTGMLTIYAGTSADDVKALTLTVLEELRKVRDNIQSDEIQKVRTQFKAGMLMGLESPSSRCERLARNIAVWGRVVNTSETIAQIEEIDVKKLQILIDKMILNTTPSAVFYGPVDGAPMVDELTSKLVA